MLQKNGEGQATALVFLNENRICGFYPFLKRKIPARFCGDLNLIDLETPYGYGGPAVFTKEADELKEMKKLHLEWCVSQGVVAEFIRFNPLARDSLNFVEKNQLCLNRKTVSMNLLNGFSDILENATAAKRRNFRKAQAASLVYTDCSLEEFVPLYMATMKHIKAEDYYFFSIDYFNSLFKLSQHILSARAVRTESGTIAAAAVFLEDKCSRHYHLGASDQEFLNLRPNDFLLFKAAEEASLSGKEIMHLGGGLSLDESDSLFRFKKGFSGHLTAFYIGRIIHQPARYRKISELWQRKTGGNPEILLHYHYGASL